MEYLIGFYIIGVVFMSLFIVYRLLEEKRVTIPDLTKFQTFYTSVITCIIWPAFVVWLVYKCWKNIKVL
jgi:hypothetical protein